MTFHRKSSHTQLKVYTIYGNPTINKIIGLFPQMKPQIVICILNVLFVLITAREINQKTLDSLKNREEWKNCTYDDGYGYLTIGYGHKIKSGDLYKIGSCLTTDQGLELLKNDLFEATSCVENYIKVPLSDNEFGALVSWTFNVGCPQAKNSTLVKVLNEGNKAGVCDQFRRWDKSNRTISAGLIKRREEECDLFTSSNDEPVPEFDLSCTIGLFGFCLKRFDHYREIYCYYHCERSQSTGFCELNFLGFRDPWCM